MELKDNLIKYNFNDKDWPTPGEAVETTNDETSSESASVKPSLQASIINKGGEDDSSVTNTTTTTQGAKKGSKNKWRPLEFEPPTKPERRPRPSRNNRKDSINLDNSQSSEVPNGGATSSKKYGDNNMLQALNNNRINNVSSAPSSSDKGFRGGRRGRGRGRGGLPPQSNSSNSGGGNVGPGASGPTHRGGGGRSNRGYDPGRITPNHEDFPADIAYYVDYSPISDAAISNEPEIDIGIISPTLGPPTPAAVAAAFVSPAIVPTTTTFVPTAAFFSPYAAAVTTTALQDPNVLKKLIKSQVEYYFSEENLQRDFFLRRKMDEEGYLPISLIASFHRVKALTTEIAMVMDALRGSEKVEFNEDGTKLRTIIDPLKWPIFDQTQPQIASTASLGTKFTY